MSPPPRRASDDRRLPDQLRWGDVRTILQCAQVLFQQLSGQPSVLYYANRIFETAGLGFEAAVGVGVFKLVMTLVSVQASATDFTPAPTGPQGTPGPPRRGGTSDAARARCGYSAQYGMHGNVSLMVQLFVLVFGAAV